MEKPRNSYYAGHRRRLKKRFLEGGCSGLHDYEVVELILFYALPRKDVKPLAKQLVHHFGGVHGLLDAAMEELTAVPGISTHTALLIKLIKETGPLYLKKVIQDKPAISSIDDLMEYCLTSMGGLKDEHFTVIFLNAQNRVIHIETLQKGTVNQAFIHPRMVLEHALNRKASAVILVHNHPSGHPRPSQADISLTKTIVSAARMLDITVHDHVIIGGNTYFSMRSEGLLT